MDTAQRALLVKQLRLELKNDKWTPVQRSQVDNYRRFWSGSGRPGRVSRRALPADAADRQRRLARWESSPRGMNLGETMRGILQNDSAGNSAHPMRNEVIHRANRQMQSRTNFSGPNGVLRTITPSERVNVVGVRSRRRRLSGSLARAYGWN